MTRRFTLAAAAMLAMMLGCASAHAETPIEPLGLVAGPILSDEELAQLRGGFAWEGIEVRLGAEVRSYLRDELVMQTNVTWSENGADVTRFVSGTLTEATAANLRSGLISGNGITMHAGGNSVYLSSDQQTAFLQRADGALQNVVVNTANGADIRQEVDVTLDLANFAPLQATNLTDRLSTGLASEIATGIGAFSF
ncbi:MAG: hypothetical protein ABW203_08175 [Novosphingobium sp.]